jgi:tetratricopeptide (TPR) repeat protein
MDLKKRSRRRIEVSLPRKLLFSVVATVAFFVGLECLLAWIGVRPITRREDPFVGFSGKLPLMELSTKKDGTQVLTTAANKLHWFNQQSFPKVKGSKTRRIFCMGGSTTFGHPYDDSLSFSRWMREFLPVVDPRHDWEVINAGGISYASYRVAALMDELSQYEPDLFVVYSVHNEFLERRTYSDLFNKSKLQLDTQALLAGTRTWAIADRLIKRTKLFSDAQTASESEGQKLDVLHAEVDEILNHTVGPIDYQRDREWRAKVIYHYETNLKRMVDIAAQSGAKIVFVTPAANEMGCSPFKSQHDLKLTEADYLKLATISIPEISHMDRENAPLALENLRAAIAIDPLYADYHYRLGHAHFALGDFKNAGESFARALNEDVCPLRAVGEIRESIVRVVAEKRVPMVDFEGKLRALSETENGHSILGEEYFVDHVHPTIDVNRRLAIWIVESLQQNGMVPGTAINSLSLANHLALLESKVLGEIDDKSIGISMRNLAKVFHWAGKYDEAISRARDALELLANDPESRFVLADSLSHTGHLEEALNEFDRLFANGFEYPRAFEPYGELLAEFGQLEQAKAYFLLAILKNDKSANAYFWLGIVHLRLGEFQFALESLQHSQRLVPENAQTLFYLAQANASLGKHTDANKLFVKLLSQGIQSANIHYQYGLSLLADKRQAEAKLQFQAALELAPEWEDAKTQLENASNDSL